MLTSLGEKIIQLTAKLSITRHWTRKSHMLFRTLYFILYSPLNHLCSIEVYLVTKPFRAVPATSASNGLLNLFIKIKRKRGRSLTKSGRIFSRAAYSRYFYMQKTQGQNYVILVFGWIICNVAYISIFMTQPTEWCKKKVILCHFIIYYITNKWWHIFLLNLCMYGSAIHDHPWYDAHGFSSFFVK